MDKSESLERLKVWVYNVMQNIPIPKIYWEETVKRGKKLGEKTDWAQGEYLGITEEGFFADSEITYAGYIDPTNPNNCYYVSIYPYLEDWDNRYLKLSLSEFSIHPQSTWASAKQHKINPDGTYTYVWSGNELYDITDLVLGNPARFKFVNWNKNPFEVK